MSMKAAMRKQSQLLIETVCKKPSEEDERSHASSSTTAGSPLLAPECSWVSERKSKMKLMPFACNRDMLDTIKGMSGCPPGEDDEENEEEEYMTPFAKKYFASENMEKYSELMEAMQVAYETDGKDEDAMRSFTVHWKCFTDYSWCSKWDGIKYDIVFFGVSGYTGYLMMEYLKRVPLKRNRDDFTFAFAGRTPEKVMEMRDREFTGTKWADTPILKASFDDVLSIIDLVRSAHVIVNVAGPYMLTEGEVLIDACTQFGTHYVDISGEIPWSLRVQELHKVAKDAGVMVVPSAALAGGYPDLGVYLCAKKLREDYGEEIRHAVCYAGSGGQGGSPSGGTLKTRAAMASSGDEVRKMMADPFSLGGFIPDVDRHGVKFVNIEQGTGVITMKRRHEDMDSNMAKITEDTRLGLWRAPYVYAYFDTRVVRRANALHADLGNMPFGRSFNFMEYAMLPPDVASTAKTAGKGASVDAEKAKLQAEGKYYKEGEGPLLEELTDAWNGFFFWAETASGHTTKCCFVGADQYFETARVAIETALTLRFDRAKLPYKGGVLTTSTAGGDCLVKRLIESGLQYKMGEWIDYKLCKPPSM